MNLEEVLIDIPVFPVMGEALTGENAFEIKVSDFKTELLHLKDSSKSSLFQMYMDEKRKVQKKKFALGGYLEDRSWYARSPLFGKLRSIHIAVDIWADENAAVYAPLDGVIHSFSDNEGFGNYGPTLILEHHAGDQTFYTLYGHLSRKNISQWEVGTKIEKGTIIGNLGHMTENGDWPAHLHFQIIRDLQGMHGDYPGVAAPEDVNFYKINCPDPDLLLRFRKENS